MRRLVISACAIAITAPMVAAPSLAATPRAESVVAAAAPAAIYVPTHDLTQKANAEARRMRDKMPFISKLPTLVGNELVWKIDISPMRVTSTKGSALLDRVGGTLIVGPAGANFRFPLGNQNSSKPLLVKRLPSRLVTKAGPQEFRVTLPRKVAAELRKISKSEVARRIAVLMWDDKDVDTTHPGYDRRQMADSSMPSRVVKYLQSRRSAVEPRGWRRPVPTTSLVRASSWLPATTVLYNGSPYDVAVSMQSVQCNYFTGGIGYQQVPVAFPDPLTSGSSFEWWNAAQTYGSNTLTTSLSTAQKHAEGPWKSLTKTALESLGNAGLVNRITGSAAKGLHLFASSFAVGLVEMGVVAAIVNHKTWYDGCSNAGTAFNIAWTNVSLGATQTPGNVNYWVPSFNRTANMVSVPVTSVPAVAAGSPLTGYNATSQNGLAASTQDLEKELGFGGSVTLATMNAGCTGSTCPPDSCVYTNQQKGNPNSTAATTAYGSSSLGGGTTAAWGPCNATLWSTGRTPRDMDHANYTYTAFNQALSLMIGYSTTAYATAGPSPAVPQPTTASDAAACVATATPCAFYQSATGSTPAEFGCTPGTWNMLTPWSSTTPTMNLSSPPSAYKAASELSMQLAFTGVKNGVTGTYFAPPGQGGNVTSSFSPSAVNVWAMTPSRLKAVQQVLGEGGYVTEWLCVMTAATTIPSGIPPTSTAMNLGWYGVPSIVSVANPAGNVLSPPAQ